MPRSDPVHGVITVYGIDDGWGDAAGLQDKAGELTRGAPTDDGALRYEFTVRLRRRPDGTIGWSGEHVHGPARDQFVYVSFRRTDGEPGWQRRIKVMLPTEAPDGLRGLSARVPDLHRTRAVVDWVLES